VRKTFKKKKGLEVHKRESAEELTHGGKGRTRGMHLIPSLKKMESLRKKELRGKKRTRSASIVSGTKSIRDTPCQTFKKSSGKSRGTVKKRWEAAI